MLNSVECQIKQNESVECQIKRNECCVGLVECQIKRNVNAVLKWNVKLSRMCWNGMSNKAE